LQLVIRWVPGHEGISGNERADVEAKEAARGNTSTSHIDLLPPILKSTLPRSKSTRVQHFRGVLKNKALRFFKKSPRWKRLKPLDPTFSPEKY
ncbi:hypothetical protein JAAARDRAFT_106345, partial [Jaapia argillacea MUCL 33604]